MAGMDNEIHVYDLLGGMEKAANAYYRRINGENIRRQLERINDLSSAQTSQGGSSDEIVVRESKDNTNP